MLALGSGFSSGRRPAVAAAITGLPVDYFNPVATRTVTMEAPPERIRVLHVDDSPTQIRLTKESLRDVQEDLEVVSEQTVDDGLARLRDPEVTIDCVVSDYAMPDRDGLDFLTAVRADGLELPFILFTGRGSEEIASKAISAGVTDYLQKGGGVNTYELLANRIENAVAKSRAERNVKRVYDAMEAAREGISLLDEEGRFTYVNRAYADLYGYDPAEMIGEHWSLIYPSDQVQHVSDDILAAVNEGEAWHGETTGLRKDGSTFAEDHTLVQREDGGLICSVRKLEEDGSF